MALLCHTRAPVIASLCRHIVSGPTLDGLRRGEGSVPEAVRCQVGIIIIGVGHDHVGADGRAVLLHFDSRLRGLCLSVGGTRHGYAAHL